MRKFKVLIFLILLMLCLNFTLACNNGNKSGIKSGITPVYQGMTISDVNNSSNVIQKNNFGQKQIKTFMSLSEETNSEYSGDYTDKTGEINQEEPFGEDIPTIDEQIQSNLQIIGSGKEIYYADKNQDIFVNIRISNPDNYEIMSFTLNGNKYSSYMFEDGSDMENLILKLNVGDVAGIIEYTIDAIKYINGTEIKDVLMDGDKTVKAGIRSNDLTYINISEEKVTLREFSFNINVVDLYNLIEKSEGYVKAFLYDGQTLLQIEDLIVGQNLITFDNLKPNTLYQYSVVGLYDNLSGNGIALNTFIKETFYTNAIVLFDNIVVGQEDIGFNFKWDDNYPSKTITSIELYLNSVKVDKNIMVTDETIIDLLSNNQYTIVANYNNFDNIQEPITIIFTTKAKAVPVIDISVYDSTQTSINFEINETDLDEVGGITKIELIKGEEIITAVNTEIREFTELLSDNTYMVKVTYVYDLNDGKGEIIVSKTQEVTTKAKAIPVIDISVYDSTQTSINFDIDITDIDAVGNITAIEIYKGNELIESLSNLEVREFIGLLSNNEYEIKTTYSYDANDGLGIQTITSIYSYFTSPEFQVLSTECINTSAVSTGDTVIIQIDIKNPNNVNVTKVKINGSIIIVNSATTQTKIRVEILVGEQFEGGNTELIIEEIYGLFKLNERMYEIDSNNTATCFVNGELIVKGLKIIDEDNNELEYAANNIQLYYFITLANSTAYNIDNITISNQGIVEYISNDIIVIDNNHLKIATTLRNGWNTLVISNITYSNVSLGIKTKAVSVNNDNSIFITINSEAILISTPSDLKNMNDGKFYKLINDIDLDGIEWSEPGHFYGVFDGNGYSILNMRVVKTYGNQLVNLGLFNNVIGVIKNLTVEGLFMITVNRTDGNEYVARVGGIAANVPYILLLNNVGTKVDISVNNGGGGAAVGGLVGNAEMGKVIVRNSYNIGNVTVTTNSTMNYTCAGGLLGLSSFDSTLIIENSYNCGEIEAKTLGSSYVGGLVGCVSNVIISSSYNVGKVTNGGSLFLSYAGGLVGGASFELRVVVLNSYNIGIIISSNSGCLVSGSDWHRYVSTTNCYYMGELEISDDVVKMDTLTEILISLQSVWDTTIWDFNNTDEQGNPTLKFFNSKI